MSLEFSTQDLLGKLAVGVVLPESFSQFSLKILTELVNLDREIIYVSANKPYATVEGEFKKSGVYDKMIFIDCSSRLCGETPTDDRLILVDNPGNLTEISIAISDAIKKVEKDMFLVFDALSTLLIYVPMESLTRFAHTLGMRLKSEGTPALLLFVEQETGKEVVKFLSTIADKIFYLTIDNKGKIKSVK